jgi:hypothetical protein
LLWHAFPSEKNEKWFGCCMRQMWRVTHREGHRKLKMVVGEMTKEQIQEKIQHMIREQEQQIEKLLETKRSTNPDDVLYAICEVVILQKQTFIKELRSLL